MEVDPRIIPGLQVQRARAARGVPRIEIGPKDIENGQAVLARRTWPARREGVRLARLAQRLGSCSGRSREARSPGDHEFREENTLPGREPREQGDHRG